MKRTISWWFISFVAAMILVPMVSVAQEGNYLADLSELTHPYLYPWQFESAGSGGVAGEGVLPVELQTLTHPDLFKWRFEEVGTAGGSVGTPFIQDLQEYTHPDLFKWRFADWNRKDKAPEPQVTTPEPPKEEKPTIPEREKNVEWIALPVRTVYFDYDKSELKPAAIEAITKNVDYLKQNPTYKVLVEGHCDERGTQEYNMALGERRANAIRDYMVKLGIEKDRISIKSWGEELPVAMGHDESAWSKNRRGEMYYSVPK